MIRKVNCDKKYICKNLYEIKNQNAHTSYWKHN